MLNSKNMYLTYIQYYDDQVRYIKVYVSNKKIIFSG